MDQMSADIKHRAEINGRARQERKRSREEMEKKLAETKHIQQTEKLMTLLEEAGDESVVVKTIDYSSLVVNQFKPYYDVEAVYDDADDYYHSLWRIKTKKN